MEYISTRGKSGAVPSAVAIKTGLAPDGGLFVPQFFPRLVPEEYPAGDGDYREVAERVLRSFLTDYSPAELREAIEKAYGKNFAAPEIVPLRLVGEEMGFLELWHGPTAAFKDLALQILPYLLTGAMKKTGHRERIVILTATSGDTGKAALEGFKNVPGTTVIVFYPDRGVSEIQEKQMVTQEGQNTVVVAVEGNFDQAQAGVKSLFADPGLAAALHRKGLSFSSANSINWGRLVPQVAYYYWAWQLGIQKGLFRAGQEFNIVVPTGNFGNILAAYYGKRMGLPVHKLICASNKNKVLTDFIRTGCYDCRREFYRTSSPSMDILVSSNLERLLFELVARDAETVAGYMRSLKEHGHYSLDPGLRSRLQEDFWGGFAGEEETVATIKEVYHRYGYLLDPHTAVGVKVYYDYRRETGDNRPVVIASTASPFKFTRTVARAVMGEESCAGKDDFTLLEILSGFTGEKIPAGLQGLQKKPVRHRMKVPPERMGEVVAKILNLN